MTDLPAGWTRIPYKDLGDWYGGGTPSKANPAYWTDGTIPWLSPKDMGEDIIGATQDLIHPSAVAETSVRLVPAGSVAVVVRSGILERILPVAYVPFETTLNQDMKALVPRVGILPQWVAWGLRARGNDLLRATRKSGTTVASIEVPRFMQQQMTIPPLDEQRRIVAILEDHLSRLEVAATSLATALSLSQRLKVSAGAKIWASASACGPMRKVSTLGRLFTGSTPSTKYPEYYGDEVPFVTPAEIGGGERVVSWTRGLTTLGAEQARLTSGPSVLAVCIGATLGKIGWADFKLATNQQVNVLEPATDVADAEFAAAVMAAPDFQMAMWADASSTTLPILNKSRFGALAIPVPPLTDQVRLLEEFNEWVEAADRLREAGASALKRSAGARRSLLATAFSGQLTKESVSV